MNFQEMDISGSTILLEEMLHKKKEKMDKKDSIDQHQHQSQGGEAADKASSSANDATSDQASKDGTKGKPYNIHEAIDDIALSSTTSSTTSSTPPPPHTDYQTALEERRSGDTAATDSTETPAYDSFFEGVTKLVTNFKVLFNPTDTLYLEQAEQKETLAADTLMKEEEEKKVKEETETVIRQKEEEEKKQHESGTSRAVQGIKSAYQHFVEEQLNSKGGK